MYCDLEGVFRTGEMGNENEGSPLLMWATAIAARRGSGSLRWWEVWEAKGRSQREGVSLLFCNTLQF